MRRTITFISSRITFIRRPLTFIAFLLLLSCPSLCAQARRGMMPADVLRVAAVGDAQISPDGESVVYTVSTVDRETTRTTLWLTRTMRQTPTAARTSMPSLSGDWNASQPRWSPDGKRIAFLATRDGLTGLYVASFADWQPRLVAPLHEVNFFIPYAGESFAWSPDSRRIAFISAGDDDDGEGLTTASAGAMRTKKENDPRVIDRIQYKTRTSFSDRARTHVWLVDVDAPADRAQPRQLTNGPFHDHALAWNPRGGEVAFLSNRETEPEANNNSDIFAVDIQGRVRQLTNTQGCEYQPAWSPDGQRIAYTATTRDLTTIDSVAEDTHVWVIDAEGGRGRELTAAHDRRARSPRWSPDSRSVLYLAGDYGTTRIFRAPLQGGRHHPIYFSFPSARAPSATTLSPDADELEKETAASNSSSRHSYQINSFSVGVRGASNVETMLLAFTMTDALTPAEVWVGPGSGGLLPRRLSAHNDALLHTTTLVEPEEMRFKSFDGATVQGWLMKPVGWREGQRYPLLLSIHGGPHGMYGSSFNPTFQAYAARGYGVLYLNPRGSSGYGQKFSDGTLREWGGGDYRDLMLGVDEAVRRRAWVDPDRLGVTGGSYGGFMTNWIITQTPRFRAAVAVASLSNLISFYSTSLYQDLIHAEFGGFPWDDFELLWRWSPLRYVKAAQTPTLLLHGEQDNDVHITQAEEMYMALKRRGVESVLVRYPREGHSFREPRHRLDALERTLAWFDKYLR